MLKVFLSRNNKKEATDTCRHDILLPSFTLQQQQASSDKRDNETITGKRLHK